jgi:hypothetical protein
MTYTRSITAALLALVLVAPQGVLANTTGDENGRDLGPHGVRTPCDPQPSPASAIDAGVPAERVIGKVLAVDQDAGVAMLGTERGVLAIQGTPEMLGQLDVGDMVVVEMVDVDGDSALTPEGEGAPTKGTCT